MDPAAERGSGRLTPDQFREVVGHFASGVTVITTAADGAPLGATASAFTSLSLEPPMVVVCLNRGSDTGQAILRSGRLAVNVLGEDHAELAIRFAKHGGDKFTGTSFRDAEHGEPLLDDALACLVCRVADHVVAATHFVFLAEVEAATSRPGAPLTYFRGGFGRLELDEHRGLLSLVRSRLLEGSAGDELNEDVYAARCAIELGVARRTVGAVPPARLRELREAMEATEPLIEDGGFADLDAWIDANARFHETMVGLVDSEALLAAYRGLGLPGLDALRLPAVALDRVLVEDHRRLVEAYEAGDLEAACEAIVSHAGRPGEMSSRKAAHGVPRPISHHNQEDRCPT